MLSLIAFSKASKKPLLGANLCSSALICVSTDPISNLLLNKKIRGLSHIPLAIFRNLEYVPTQSSSESFHHRVTTRIYIWNARINAFKTKNDYQVWTPGSVFFKVSH